MASKRLKGKLGNASWELSQTRSIRVCFYKVSELGLRTTHVRSFQQGTASLSPSAGIARGNLHQRSTNSLCLTGATAELSKFKIHTSKIYCQRTIRKLCISALLHIMSDH